ncbi:MAG: hypothetical protein QOI95_3737 [Acidimicrobiaceae bacterium]|jgi:hypothetical protein
MSDQGQPGWWQASDGRWYPADQQPGYQQPGYQQPGYQQPGYQQPNPEGTWAPPGGPPAPVPPFGAPPPFLGTPTPSPARSRPWVIVIVAIAAVAIVAVAVVFLVGTKDTKRNSAGAPAATTLGTAGVTPEGFAAVADPNDEFTIAFPSDWTAASTRGDVSHIGETLMPDDPEIAARLDQIAGGILPRSAVMLGFLRDDLTRGRSFATNMNVIPTAIDPSLSLDMIVDQSTQGLERFGAEIHSTESTTLANGPAKRVRYTLTSAGVDGVQYYVLTRGQIWVLTFSTQDLEALSAEFEQIARTFVVNT